MSSLVLHDLSRILGRSGPSGPIRSCSLAPDGACSRQFSRKVILCVSKLSYNLHAGRTTDGHLSFAPWAFGAGPRRQKDSDAKKNQSSSRRGCSWRPQNNLSRRVQGNVAAWVVVVSTHLVDGDLLTANVFPNTYLR
jgi:hypothetical protein